MRPSRQKVKSWNLRPPSSRRVFLFTLILSRCSRAALHLREALQQEALVRPPQVRRAVLRGECLFSGPPRDNATYLLNLKLFPPDFRTQVPPGLRLQAQLRPPPLPGALSPGKLRPLLAVQ